MKLTPLSVYISKLGDCSNNGITSKEETIYLVDPTHGREMDTTRIDPAAIFRHEDCGEGYIRLVPVNNTKPGHAGPMYGGNIATLSRGMTSRTHPLVGKFLHVHDRYETWALNDILSR